MEQEHPVKNQSIQAERSARSLKIPPVFTLMACIALPLVVGSVSGIATAGNITTWYATLSKPGFNPPDFLFGPVWTFLYLLMGISLFLIWKSPSAPVKTRALTVFGVQLVLNFAWSFIFFHFKLPGWAFAEILLVWFSILLMILTFFRISKMAAFLQLPYLLWVSFAAVLNGSIWYLN